MPRRQTHTTVGLLAGAGAALYHARTETADAQALEVLGGALGGYWGGLLPDVLEPATSPHHRDLAHSLLALAAVLRLSLEASRARCRAVAREHRTAAACAPDGSAAQGWAVLGDALCTIAAGIVTGLQAGYVSHLVLDGGTAKRLPLLLGVASTGGGVARYRPQSHAERVTR